MQILGADGQPVTSSGPGDAAPQGAGQGAQDQPAPQRGAPAGELIKEGTDQSFMADVVEPSRQIPVLVDFWAPWCGPCKQLGPVLESAVTKANGAVRLVKINIDENPGIAGQLRIQSIPAVIAFQDGQPVDGFMGALPEGQVREFIKRLSGGAGGDEAAALRERAETALSEGDLGGAAQDFAQAIQTDPDDMAAVAGLARVHMAGGDPAKARELIDQVPEPKKTDPAILGVRAALSLSGEIEDAGDPAELRAKAEAAPNDPELQYELARALIASGDLQAGADALLDSIAADRAWNEEAARRLLLQVFDAAGPGSEVAAAGRRRLSSILFA